MSDEILDPLANDPSNNSRLRELSLSNNGDVTAVGWEALLDVFLNPNSTLEVLDLSNNRIDDQVMVPLADVLANNEKLKAWTIGCASACFLNLLLPPMTAVMPLVACCVTHQAF